MATIYEPFDSSRISEGFGWAAWRNGVHNGVDFAIPAGTELRATASGVVYNNDAGGDGAGVDITTDDGWKVRMWHVSKFLVANGSYVNAGDVVALSGGIPGTWGAGRTTGAHMHWGVKTGAGWVDPYSLGPISFGGAAPSRPSVDGDVASLAAAVLRGDFGNGPARQAALGSRFEEVQAEVNRILNGGAPAAAPAPAAANNVVQKGDGYWHIAQRVWGGDNATIEANMRKLIDLNGNKRLFAGDTVILEAPAPAPAAANNVVQSGDGYWHIAARVWGGDNATIEANMNKLIELNGAKRLYAGDTVILDAPAPTPAPIAPTPAPIPTVEEVKEIVQPTPVPVVEETKTNGKVIETPIKKVKDKPVEKQLTAKEIAAIEKRQKAVFASVNAPVDLGAIITNPKTRFFTWAVYGLTGLLIIGFMGGLTAAQWIAPEWFIFATGAYTAIGPAFASLAMANISKK